jgi:hypothetical protein
MINQLLLSKRLYLCGSDYVDKPDPISAGMAISLFHDSIEIFCWSVLKDLDAKVKDTTLFTSFFDLVENAPNNKESKKLPFKAKILQLNKARVNFKHYGNLPDISEAKKFKEYTEEFLQLSFNDFFETDFDSISLSQLIPFDDIKSSITCSEKALADENIEDCMCELAKAKNQLFSKFSSYLPEVDRHLREADRIFENGMKTSRIRIFGYLTEYLNALRNLNFVSLCGVSIKEYFLMEQHLPHAYKTADGKWHFNLKSCKVSKTDAKNMINFLTNLSLKLSQFIS